MNLLRIKSLCFLTFFLSILIINYLYAQRLEDEDTARIYLRKSISFYDGFLLTSGVSIPNDKYEYLLNEFRKNVINHEVLIRFDHNPIPSELMKRTKEEFSRLRSPTVDNVKEIIDKTFGPIILKVLDIEKEVRAKEFVNRLERNNFLTTKAKEIGITAEDLEKVMNAGYVIIPYISWYEERESKVYEKGKDYCIGGGVLIYHLETTTPPKFSLSGFKANIGASSYIRLNPDGFISAVTDFIEDFEVLIHDFFKISCEITSVYGDRAVINAGQELGVLMDNKFNFVEYYKDKDGVIKQKEIGYGIVKKVGIKESEIQVIIGRPEKGMLAVERPRSRFEKRLSFVSFPVKYLLDSLDHQEEVVFCLGLNSLFPPLYWIDNTMLISKELGIPQTFVTLNLLGYGFIKGSTFREREESKNKFTITMRWPPYYIEIAKLGLLKKFYIRRFALGIKMAAKYSYIEIGAGLLGGEIGGLLEFVIDPNVNLGISVCHGLSKTWKKRWLTSENHYVYGTASLNTVGGEIYLTINTKLW